MLSLEALQGQGSMAMHFTALAQSTALRPVGFELSAGFDDTAKNAGGPKGKGDQHRGEARLGGVRTHWNEGFRARAENI